jgi:hypothetical protein
VATTTAHCIPTAGWVERLVAADLEQIVAMGGTIENDAAAGAKGRAIYLLRYAPFAPPAFAGEVRELAADNALYRRSDLSRHGDLLERGFWEPSFHDRFRAEGLHLALNPDLRVVHRNRYTARQFIGQRFAHGREFGLTRASGRSFVQRLALLLVVPAAFPLILSRILRRALVKPELRRQPIAAWLWLLVFLLAWVAGEGFGYLGSLRERKNHQPESSR